MKDRLSGLEILLLIWFSGLMVEEVRQSLEQVSESSHSKGQALTIGRS